MEKSRKTKVGILIFLLVMVVLLTVGFAAFGSELTIKSSAEVKGNENAFSVVFSASKTEATGGDPVCSGNATGGTFDQPTTVLSGLTANFTEPGQKATWTVYSFNRGQFDAFLNSVTLGNIVCTAGPNTDQVKVNEAAKGISIKVTVGGVTYTDDELDILGHELAIGSGEEVKVELEYAAGSAIADGDFAVAVDGDIVLNYESID